MNKQLLALLVFGLSSTTSCKQHKSTQLSDVEIWELGWRMIASSMEEDYELASLQFDSLRNSTQTIDWKYLVKGLEAKNEMGQVDEVAEIVSSQDSNVLQAICRNPFLSNLAACKAYSTEAIGNKELQLELIKMYIDDQAARGNVMQDIILKYEIDSTEITPNGSISVDKRNRARLKEIIEEYGFPTRALVGKAAMNGVFLMIQHSDGDKEWQKSQLINVEKAVKMGDMDGQSYAYLYDRIKINSGEKQRYGTQFSNVDPINKTVELADTEDIENLDRRRMEIGMMPIKMYRKFTLESI